ncbi:unnamed protein product [Vitrella brassicaformis CCMP3155]|uniref:Ribosome biogenesis protein NSA1 n=2 Tax=Vitrella brassicaformis TaxID=1169539 RepID=A0A0G4EPE7_VITBC|nr:unnamed protein product [Vitrella brassicaformis CCMP3155]|eukprot:CEL99125.1 unnamed protein product [Vitrella brassicaformis CCMP3155]
MERSRRCLLNRAAESRTAPSLFDAGWDESEVTIGRQDGRVESFTAEGVRTRRCLFPSAVLHVGWLDAPPAKRSIDQIRSRYASPRHLLVCTTAGECAIIRWRGTFDSSHTWVFPGVASKAAMETKKTIKARTASIPCEWHAALHSGHDSDDGEGVTVKQEEPDDEGEQQEEAEASGGEQDGRPPPFVIMSCRLPGPIAAVVSDPLCPSRVAFGGADNDVKVADLRTCEMEWAAKNVKNDELDLRVPVNVTAVAFLSHLSLGRPTSHVIATASLSGRLRIYDISQQRRPLVDVGVSEQPVVCVAVQPVFRSISAGWSDVSHRVVKEETEVARPAKRRKTGAAGGVADDEITEYVIDDDEDLPQDGSNKQPQEDPAADAMRANTTLYASAVPPSCRKAEEQDAAREETPAPADNSATSAVILVGNTVGALLKYRVTARREIKAGKRKKQQGEAPAASVAYSADMVGGYAGVMGGIKAMCCHESGEYVLAVGLGRHAYIFHNQSRKLMTKVYLKQKLTAALFSSDPYVPPLRAVKSENEETKTNTRAAQDKGTLEASDSDEDENGDVDEGDEDDGDDEIGDEEGEEEDNDSGDD